MSSSPLKQSLVDSCSAEPGKQKEIYDSDFELAGSFGLRINQRGRKSFFLIYSLSGKRKRITLGKHPQLSLEEAKQKAAEIIEEVQGGADPAAKLKQLKNRPSFEKVAELCFADLRSRARSETTLKEYERIAKKELFPLLGDRQLHALEFDELAELLERIVIERDALSYSNRVRSVLNSIFGFAEENSYLKYNFIKDLPRFDEAKAKKLEHLSIQELQDFYLQSAKLNPEATMLLRFILLSGQKIGSCIRAKWSDIDLGCWAVDGQNNHRIYLSKSCLQILHRSKSLQSAKGFSNCPFLFASPTGRRFDGIRHVIRIANLHKKNATERLDLRTINLSIQPAMITAGLRKDIVSYIRGSTRIINSLESANEIEYYQGATSSALEQWSKILTGKSKKYESKIVELFSE